MDVFIGLGLVAGALVLIRFVRKHGFRMVPCG